MMTKAAVLISVVLGGTAIAAPPRAQVLTGKHAEVRNLLAEVRSARNAIRRDEPKVATDLVRDAIALDRKLGAQHRFALLATERGELEEVGPTKGAPVAQVYDRVTERDFLDLKVTRLDLERARTALRTGKLAAAETALEKVDRAITVQEHITPEPSKLAAENLRFAIREIEAGKWQAAKTDLAAVMHDVAQQAAIKTPSH